MKFLNFNGLVKLLWTDLHRKHVIPHQSFPSHSPPKAKDYKYTNLFNDYTCQKPCKSYTNRNYFLSVFIYCIHFYGATSKFTFLNENDL